MGKIISIVNKKGGVGKTTFTLNASFELAKKGKKILLVDNDPQGNATSCLCPNEDEISHYFHECFSDPNQNILDKVICKSENFKIDCIASCILLENVETQLQGKHGREIYLKRILTPIKDQYDYILIDCGPTLGILTANALTAADKFLIATRPEKFALDGIEMLLTSVNSIKEFLNPFLTLAGVCITWMPNTNIAKKHRSEIFNFFKDKLYKTDISQNKDIEEAHDAHLPVSKYNPKCKSSGQYKDLIEELLEWL